MYLIETRFGFYTPAGKAAWYRWPESFNASRVDAERYSEKQARKVSGRLTARGYNVNLQEA